MFKNVASQTVTLYAVDVSTGLPKTGDAANMLFYVSKDDGTVTVIAANSGVPTEVDSTNGKGLYKIALAQAETNADKLLFSGKSSTSNIVVAPTVIYTAQSTPIATGVKKNTALSNFPIAMTATGLTVTVTVFIDGADGVASTNAASEVGHNMYKINLAAADLNGAVIGLKAVDNLGNVQWYTILTTV